MGRGYTMSAPRRAAFFAMVAAAALVLSFFEHLLPPLWPMPGVKLGLTNIITLYMLAEYGIRGAFIVSCIRIVLCALLFAGVMSLPYAAMGAMLSLLVMAALMRLVPKVFSLMGVSVAGAFAHNCGQLLAASFFLRGFTVFAYFPWMTLLSLPTGVFVGLCARCLVHAPFIKHIDFSRGGNHG